MPELQTVHELTDAELRRDTAYHFARFTGYCQMGELSDANKCMSVIDDLLDEYNRRRARPVR